MTTEESIITTQAIFTQDKTHRVLLKKTWDESLPSAAILMTNPSAANSIYAMDYTTMFCVNALSALGYGSISIVNLFSFMTSKLDLKMDFSELACEENTEQIMRAASENDIFIVAVGSLADTYKKVAAYQHTLFEKLREHQHKVHTIAASDGTENLHPLSPNLRNRVWTLTPFQLPLEPVEVREGAAQSGEATSTTGRCRRKQSPES